MKNSYRLLLVAALITVEMLCAESAPSDQDSGPRHRGPGGPGGGPGRMPPILQALDADHDGEISAAEIATAAAAIRKLDVNGDGSVSVDELRPVRPADAPTPPADAGPRGPRGPGGRSGRPHPVLPVMLALDANGDGALSAVEITNAPASLKALDANGDGKLTHDELRPLPPTN